MSKALGTPGRPPGRRPPGAGLRPPSPS